MHSLAMLCMQSSPESRILGVEVVTMPKTKDPTLKIDDRPAWRRAAPSEPKSPAAAPGRKRKKAPEVDYERRRREAQEAADIIREVREEEEE